MYAIILLGLATQLAPGGGGGGGRTAVPRDGPRGFFARQTEEALKVQVPGFAL